MSRLINVDVKSKAIEVATELVRRQGGEKFRLTDVAKEMGITHAALYNYFKSKDELLDSINEAWLYRMDEELEKIIHQNDDALTRMKGWFVQLYEMKREKARLDIQPYSTLVDATLKEKLYIREHLNIQFSQLSQLCNEAMTTYKIKCDVKELVRLLLEATIMFHDPKFVKDTAALNRKDDLLRLLDVLLRGIFGDVDTNSHTNAESAMNCQQGPALKG